MLFDVLPFSEYSVATTDNFRNTFNDLFRSKLKKKIRLRKNTLD